MGDPHESHWFRHDPVSGLWVCSFCLAALDDGIAEHWCMPPGDMRARWHAFLDEQRGGIRPPRGVNAQHCRAQVVTDRMARNAVHAMRYHAQRLSEMARAYGVEPTVLRARIDEIPGLELPGPEFLLDQRSARGRRASVVVEGRG